MDEEIERTLHINREVKLYRIPPRPASTGHISGNWRVADQIFAGRLRVLARGSDAEVRLEDGSTGELFAVCPFTPETQAVAIEPAVDSSRNFVLRVEDPATRRHAFLGLGFAERGEAFDFNAALDDHARQCQRDKILAQGPPAAALAAGSSSSSGGSSSAAAAARPVAMDPALASLYRDPGDLSLREGQTIRINVHHGASKPGGFLSRAAGGSGSFTAQLPGPAVGSSSSGGGGGSSKGLLPPAILPPPPVPQQAYPGGVLSSPGAAAAAPAPAAVTVASRQENWAKFD